jgi:hypothetical protein
MPIEELVITGCAIQDVSPIASCPLRRLIYGPDVPKGLDLLPSTCAQIYRARSPNR